MIMLLEGKFGPGTSKNMAISDKNWKVTIGAIENKNRPESIYITVSSWASPKMSVIKAKQFATDDQNSLATAVMKEFDGELKKASKKIASFFDSNYFDTSSLIFTYDFAFQQAKPNKAQFVEFEINIDTVNNIDRDGNPIPTVGTGKIMTLVFKDFEPYLSKALHKILAMDVFSSSQLVDFNKTKR